ncbi:MAG: polysaccharide biosynthesis/export family protein [Pseudomonadota bacterium]
MKSLLIKTIVVMSLSGCAAAVRPYDYAKEPDPRKGEYVLGESDVLQITIWGHSELSGQVRIRPDRTITLPLLGDLEAAGNTPRGLRMAIQRRLIAFIKDAAATATVAVVDVNSYRFTVTGNVARPGLFSPRRYVTIAEAIAMAGGPDRFASSEKVVIVRQDDDGAIRKIPIDYAAISVGKKHEQNLVLLRGDRVHVP